MYVRDQVKIKKNYLFLNFWDYKPMISFLIYFYIHVVVERRI